MWLIIREIFTYFTFLSLLYFITYSNINQNSFYQVGHLRKFLLNTRQIDNDYTKVYRSLIRLKNFVLISRFQQLINIGHG
jgi:hypothetical protein